MDRRPNVFITNRVNKTDYSAAADFGNLTTVSDKIYSFTPGSLANEIMSADVNRSADRFDPQEDYVLPSGSAISTALFILALWKRGIRTVRVLMWNGNEQNYHVGQLHLDDIYSLQGVANV